MSINLYNLVQRIVLGTREEKKQTKLTRPATSLNTNRAPDKLVEVEEIYTRALPDSGAKVTLLTQDFYNKHFEVYAFAKVGSNGDCNGYLQIKLSLNSLSVGQPVSLNTLAVVCSQPPGSMRACERPLIIESNTSFMRQLLALVTPRSYSKHRQEEGSKRQSALPRDCPMTH